VIKSLGWLIVKNLLEVLATALLLGQLDVQFNYVGLGVILGGNHAHDTRSDIVKSGLLAGGVV
jgi:hypothetical protein